MATPSSSTPPASSSLLAPGFRFHPTDEELVIYYLKRKVLNRPLRLDAIAEVELYKAEPWDLPALSRLQSRDMEWYFFSPLDRKYANRSRTNRATNQGYWKTTGKDRPIRHGPRVVGMKKTLVFHVGRAPRGERTNWVMHEYRLEDDELARDGVSQDSYVVCRIFQKSGSGPQNGAQYGAPFVEEEWDEEAGNMPLAGDDSGDGDAVNLVVAPVNGGDKTIAGNGEYLQLSDFVDNQDQDNQPGNGGLLMPDCDGHNSGGAPEGDPIFLVEGIFQEQRVDDVSPNRAQNEGYLNLNNNIGVDEFFDPTNENTYSPSMMFQLNDLYPEGNDLNSILGDFPSNQTGEETLAFYDASSNDLPFGTDSFLQMDDLYPPMTAGSFGLNAMDDIATYFNNDSSASNESIFSPEVGSRTPEPAQASEADVGGSRTPEPAQASEADVGASSVRRSTTMIENVTAAPDSQGSKGCERTFTRRLVDMLGSVPAPPALAAEPPTTPGKSLGQFSVTTPASSIHVTAGMIEIHGFKATGGVDHWSLHKDGDVGLLFSYGVASSKLDGSDSFKIRGWSMSVVLRGGFYLFFLSAMVLALCVKVGIHGYCS